MSATFNSVEKSGRVQRSGRDRRGFSHPASFEVLEQRLTLNIAPGTTEFGFQSPATGVVIEQGLFSLPGAASPTNGTNPANYALVDSTGTQIPDTHVTGPATFDALGFDNPSFIPNDRPPMPGWNLPPEISPINTAQVASTPYGIRNFEIGANTGVRHRNTVPLGLGHPTVRIPTETRTAMDDLIGDPGESPTLGQDEGALGQLVLDSHRPSQEPRFDRSESSDHLLVARNAGHPDAEVSQAAELAADEEIEEPSPIPPLLDAAAVDQTMATIDAGATAPVVQASEPMDVETTEAPPNASEAAHALAASIAAGAVFVAREPESRNVPSIGIRH